MMALHKSYVINTGNRDIAADELALTGMVHLIGMLPIIAEANNNKQFADEKFLEQANNLLASRIGKSITSTWEFPSSCIYAVEVWNKYKLRRSEVTYVDFIRGAYAIEDLIADRVIAEQVFDDLTSKGILPSIEYIQSDVYKRDVVLANEIYGD
jgi:HD-like signal output (HDOD) protein